MGVSARRADNVSRGGAENTEREAGGCLYYLHCNLREKPGQILENIFNRSVAAVKSDGPVNSAVRSCPPFNVRNKPKRRLGVRSKSHSGGTPN